MVNGRLREAIAPRASVTTTATVKLPLCVGVPV